MVPQGGEATVSEKRYIIRKYVSASSVQEALNKEPTTAVEEVFVDEKANEKSISDAVGFKYLPECQE